MASIATAAPDQPLAWTAGHGDAARRLSDTEACFIAVAAALILPEPICAGMTVDTVGFVDEMLAADVGGDGATVMWQYRRGVAAVQRHCMSLHGRPFEQLHVRDQHRVLSLLEDGCPEAGFEEHAELFELLVLHASQAYFGDTFIPTRLGC